VEGVLLSPSLQLACLLWLILKDQMLKSLRVLYNSFSLNSDYYRIDSSRAIENQKELYPNQIDYRPYLISRYFWGEQVTL
jgi:hypothetical protein